MASLDSALHLLLLTVFNLAFFRDNCKFLVNWFIFSLIFGASPLISASAEFLLEDGYIVTTVIDGHKIGVNPYAVLPRPGSPDLIVLDSSNSIFYTLSLPLSTESPIKRLSGNGSGYSDGNLDSALFRNPRNFAMDTKGNIYVADKKNHVIRKIGDKGVSTIAGGYSQSLKPVGHEDGPAQNATFSTDFDIAFVAEECALLISDHGNQLIRQINLKPDDCTTKSPPGVGGASIVIWAIGLGFSCLIGIVFGIVIRPYIIRSEGLSGSHCMQTWKLSRTHLGSQAWIRFSGIRSAIASSLVLASLKRLLWLSLSHLSLLFRMVSAEPQAVPSKSVSLLDDESFITGEIMKSKLDFYADQLKDLIDFGGNVESSSNSGNEEDDIVGTTSFMESMIEANIMNFTKRVGGSVPLETSLGLVRRK